jgi:enamine deaminase RidA (YjgF/YER057c/UK114 family)
MIEQKLAELGIVVPEAPKPLASYVPAVVTGDFVFTSGQLPMQNGALQFPGQLGAGVSIDEGKKAARISVINCLSVIKSVIGDLEQIEHVVKVTVFISSAPGFGEQPEVANGASDLLLEIFGEAGKHSRSAVGVSALPRNAAVEIEMIVKVK